MLPSFLQQVVITAYVGALNYAFIVIVPAAGVTIVSALFVKNYNLKKRGITPGTAVA